MRPATPSLRAVSYVTKMAESAMTSSVIVKRPGTPTMNQTTGVMTAVNHSTIYHGKARVYPSTGGQTMLLGDEVTVLRTTYVSIPASAPVPRVDDLVTVELHNDPALVGAQLRVLDVSAGGMITPVRQLTCQSVEPNPYWNAS